MQMQSLEGEPPIERKEKSKTAKILPHIIHDSESSVPI